MTRTNRKLICLDRKVECQSDLEIYAAADGSLDLERSMSMLLGVTYGQGNSTDIIAARIG